jgi:hypothetical protein
MPRSLTLESAGGRVVASRTSGISAHLRMDGMGLPPVENQWFEGAGGGSRWRTARVLARPLNLDLKVYGRDADEVEAGLGLLGRVFAPTAGPVRLTVTRDGVSWYTDVRRTGGGDWAWDADTDGETFVKTIISVQAGDPYWTSIDEQSRLIEGFSAREGLLNGVSLIELRLSSGLGYGAIDMHNPGDVPAYPVTRVHGPFTSFRLSRSSLQGAPSVYVVRTVPLGGWIEVDHLRGTVTDEQGINRYTSVSTTPEFWAIEPGNSQARIEINGSSPDTKAEMRWYARKWVVF